MKRTHWLGFAALLLAVAAARPASAGPAEDAASALAQVPAKAPIVIQLRGIEQTKDHLIAMIKEALPDLGAQAEEKINGLMRQGLDGRSLKGLVKGGPVFVVFSDLPKSHDEAEFKQKTAVLLHVTKYAEFRDGILNDEERKALKKENGCDVTQINGEDAYFVDRGEYAVVAQTKEAAKAFAKKPAQGLDGKLAKDLAAKLLESDLAVYVDMTAVRAQFSEQIAQAKEEVEKKLGDADGVPGLEKGQMELVKRMIGPVFQAIEDSQAVLLAVDLRKPGLSIHAQASVGGGSKTNQLLKDMKPTAFDELGRLPAGMMSYSAMQVRPEWVAGLGGYLYGATEASKENKDIKAAFDDIAAAKPRLRLDATSIPLKALQVWTYDDPTKAVAGQLKLLRAMKAGDVFQAAPIKDPIIKENAEKHGGFALHAFSAKWDFEKWLEKLGEAGNLPEQAKQMMPAMMKKMLGEEIHVWFGSDGKTVVQLSAKNWKAAQGLLDQYQKGKNTVGEQAAYKEARMQLSKETTFVTLADLPAFARSMLDAVPLPLAPPGKSKASFLGMAVTVQPERGSFDLWVPGTTAQEIYKMVEPVIKMFGGRFGGAS